MTHIVTTPYRNAPANISPAPLLSIAFTGYPSILIIFFPSKTIAPFSPSVITNSLDRFFIKSIANSRLFVFEKLNASSQLQKSCQLSRQLDHLNHF